MGSTRREEERALPVHPGQPCRMSRMPMAPETSAEHHCEYQRKQRVRGPTTRMESDGWREKVASNLESPWPTASCLLA